MTGMHQQPDLYLICVSDWLRLWNCKSLRAIPSDTNNVIFVLFVCLLFVFLFVYFKKVIWLLLVSYSESTETKKCKWCWCIPCDIQAGNDNFNVSLHVYVSFVNIMLNIFKQDCFLLYICSCRLTFSPRNTTREHVKLFKLKCSFRNGSADICSC